VLHTTFLCRAHNGRANEFALDSAWAPEEGTFSGGGLDFHHHHVPGVGAHSPECCGLGAAWLGTWVLRVLACVWSPCSECLAIAR